MLIKRLMEDIVMIGKMKAQLSLLDGAFNARDKRSRNDALLEKMKSFIQWNELVGDSCIDVK